MLASSAAVLEIFVARHYLRIRKARSTGVVRSEIEQAQRARMAATLPSLRV